MGTNEIPTEKIQKDWAKNPIEVRVESDDLGPFNGAWRKRYAASGNRHYATDRETISEAIRFVENRKDEVISLASYETRVVKKGSSGVYFNRFVAQLDEEDHDITRNLQTIC